MISDKKGIVLFAIAYNEEHYIHEWLNYHLSIGIDKIIVLCNGGFDFDNSKYDNRVEKVLIEQKLYETCNQNTFLNKYLTKAQDFWSYKYFIHIDIDEYIVLRGKYFGKTLEEALDEINVQYLMIRWKYFGDNGHIRVKDNNYSVIDRFTKSEDGFVARSGKSILRLTSYIDDYFSNPHYMNLAHYRMESGGVMMGGFPMFYEKDEDVNLYLAHYASKTIEEYLHRQPHQDNGQPEILPLLYRLHERFKSGVNANDKVNLDVIRCRDYYTSINMV